MEPQVEKQAARRTQEVLGEQSDDGWEPQLTEEGQGWAGKGGQGNEGREQQRIEKGCAGKGGLHTEMKEHQQIEEGWAEKKLQGADLMEHQQVMESPGVGERRLGQPENSH